MVVATHITGVGRPKLRGVKNNAHKNKQTKAFRRCSGGRVAHTGGSAKKELDKTCLKSLHAGRYNIVTESKNQF